MSPSGVAYAQAESSLKTDFQALESESFEELIVRHEERQSQQTMNYRRHQYKKEVVVMRVVQ